MHMCVGGYSPGTVITMCVLVVFSGPKECMGCVVNDTLCRYVTVYRTGTFD